MKRVVPILLCILSFNALAEPTSHPVKIQSIRPYQGVGESAGAVFIEVDSKPLCDTNTFRVELKYPGSKEIYSAALAAMMGGKKVKLEIKHRPSGCEWGHELQSLYIVN